MEIGSDFNFKIKYENNLFFVSGRIAIKHILKKIIKCNEKCLIPNYLCDSIHNCFDNYDFYAINNDLSIDVDDIHNKINKNKYKIMFIINYFGNIDKNINMIKDMCKKKYILIVEDFTHNLYSNKLYGDICVCSYRKSLEVPFGSIVIDKHNQLKTTQTSYFNVKYMFLNVLKIYGMMLKNIKILKYVWYPLLKHCESSLNTLDYDGFDYINYVFYKYCYNANDKYQRHVNYRYLSTHLKYKPMFKNKLYFTYPILFKSQKERDNVRNICIKHNIYCPIYWPLHFDKHNKCNIYVADRILCIPIDQRYSIEQMEQIVNVINK